MNLAPRYPLKDKHSRWLVIASEGKSAVRLNLRPLVRTPLAIFVDPPLQILRWAPRIYINVRGPLSPVLAPSGKRTRLGMEESPNDISPASQGPSQRSMPPLMATGDQGHLDSFDEACTQTQGPPDMRTDNEDLYRRDLHALRKQ